MECEVKPLVAFVGGPDVSARSRLAEWLSEEYEFVFIGSREDDLSKIECFSTHCYPLARGLAPLKDIVSVLVLVYYLAKLDPDVVHTFDTKPSFYGRIAAFLVRVPVIVGTLPGLGYLFVAEDRSWKLLRSVYLKLLALVCKVSDLTILQNPDDRNRLLARSVISERNSIVIRGSGVDPEVFKPSRVREANRLAVREELAAPDDVVVVTMVSRLLESKGVNEFIQAARHLDGASMDIRLVLVGRPDRESPDGIDLSNLDNVDEYCTFLGRREDVREILAASEIFVLPSYYSEGIPRVLLEAASMELPLIGANTAGVREIVKDGVTGIMIEKVNCETIAKAICSLARNPQLREKLGRNARKKVMEGLTLDHVANQTGEVYQQIIESRNCGRSSKDSY